MSSTSPSSSASSAAAPATRPLIFKAVPIELTTTVITAGGAEAEPPSPLSPSGDGDVAHKSTRLDVVSMQRMGRAQELVRHFRTLSMISFVALATSAWETNIFVFTQGLKDGGRPGVMYSLLWCFLGFVPVYLSMAEMASMAPIAGAQYHWVSEFAPARYQKMLSYLTGWTSTLAWQAGNAQGMFEVGIVIQAIITANMEYEAPRWHATVINIAFTLFALAANILGSRALPYWQNAVFALHILAFVAFLAPIWVNVPRASHHDVWALWENRGGWPSLALSILVGQMPGISAHAGIDTAAHMAEEVRDAARTIPRIMLVGFVINMVLIFLSLLTFCYHIVDIPTALADPTGYPGIWVIRQSMSQPWLNLLLAVILVLEVFGELSYFAAVSRDLFAFARDGGFPFSRWIARVDERRQVPVNAYVLSAVFSVLLSLIYLGSDVAFYAVISLCTVALLQCYLFSIGCILWRRAFHPETLPPARFSLGSWGLPVNVAAVVFSLWGFFWTFWPEEYPVTLAGFNWASVIFVGTLALALVNYYSGGRHKYHGPVVLVEGRKLRGE
ncbi:amino acid permease 2 [Cordyceps fumosorosea ARSEF 2679]|uniref:Amino acid permease 2 n=1 Tax=Cordyceps fumosorosea (strain ARSEF 2679) TaxID=1081104 RepID=A0A167LMW7_CORFA|nr:amino acid permease 2 [Cordyceps fumosorosea ARSEF 2679]OAA53276.1 amino acid permease 2 [Cordyceps fumosorosea ARSEF 2679]